MRSLMKKMGRKVVGVTKDIASHGEVKGLLKQFNGKHTVKHTLLTVGLTAVARPWGGVQ